MEVITYVLLGVTLLSLSIRYYYKSRSLQDEVGSLGELLSETLQDSERQIEDHRSSERELSILKAKLEGLEQSTLTLENSIPKDVHIEKVLDLSNRLSSTELVLQDITKKFEEARGKQISERVRLGQVGENFAAFHDQFPYSRQNAKALFQPIDLICFEDDEIIFIDVKTGNSQLSTKQRKIRDNIREGNVRFEIHRLDETGYRVEEK